MLSYKEYVENVCKKIKEVNANELSTRQDEFALLVDIRENQELSDGVIKGSIAISRGVLEASIEKYIQQYDRSEKSSLPMVLYCRSGARSALAALSLEKMGFKNVYSLQGGVNAWKEAGFSLMKVY